MSQTIEMEGNARAIGRAKAAERRRDFLARANERGVTLRPKKGVLYEAPNGDIVAITYASELQPSRWWLGVPEGVDQVVLLCQTPDGDAVALCLGRDFFRDHGDNLSRKTDRIYFNVVRSGAIYALTLPVKASSTQTLTGIASRTSPTDSRQRRVDQASCTCAASRGRGSVSRRCPRLS